MLNPYASSIFHAIKYYHQKLIMAALAICLCTAAHAREYAASSVMSQGKWVKINITEEGMQILTAARLRQMGFSDPSKVKVYGYGGYRLSEVLNSSTPDDLPQQPVVRTADGSIIFYGAGLVQWVTSKVRFGYFHINNFYSTTSSYFLSDRDGADISPEPYTTPVSTSAKEISTFTQLMVHEQDLFTPGNTGADLFGEDFRTTNKRTFTFPVTDPVGTDITFNTVFGTKTNNGGSTIALSSAGSSVGNIAIDASPSSDTYIVLRQLCATASLTDAPTADLTLSYSSAGNVLHARLDYIEAAYERRIKLHDGQLQFRHNTESGEVLCVDGCSASTVIWDVTDPAYPRPIAYELSGTRARFAPTGSGLRTYMAFNPDAVSNAPASAGNVDTQDIHGMEIPDMVIITPDAFKAHAERLAQYHRDADNMIVHVLTPEVIYNEFSSGKPDATAFRKMLKMFYDRGNAPGAANKLEHCLLFGRPSYDHRLITEIPRMAGYPRLLTWESRISFNESPGSSSISLNEGSSYCTDNYFGALADNEASFSMTNRKMDIGIGRMPVKSVQEAKTAVDKLIRYMSEPDLGDWRSHAMIIADDADDAQHLDQAQAMYANLQTNGNGADFIYERLYLDSYPIGSGGNSKTFPQARERMFKLLDEGVSFLAYIGHANPTSWTHEQLMTYSDINSLSYKHLPVIYHASCEFVRFDSDTESGAETMWLNPTSGAIAFIAANRKVYIHKNANMNTALGTYYYQRDSQGMPLPLGEVYRRTINAARTDDNQHRYTLMGDPAMRVLSPTRKLKIESIAGIDMAQALDSGNLPVIPGRSKMTVKGRVVLPSGETDDSFTGTLTATLFDAERVIETYGHDSGDGDKDGKVSVYNDRKNRLAIASFPVNNGEWEATLYLPEEIDNNYSPAMLALYASSDAGEEAMGSSTDFYVYGWDDTAAEDNDAPEISFMALGSSFFRPGDIVSQSTTFLSHVRDDSGINISTSGIGKQMMLVLDGRKIYDDLSDYFTTDTDDPTGGSISYPLDGLSEGDHELVFQVFDNAGNCAKQSLAFKVGGAGMMPDIDLRTDASPASTQANIFITTAEQPQEAKVEIFDMAGRKVWSTVPTQLSQSMNVQWDLRTSAGDRVPRGIYLYRATIVTPDGATHNRTRKLAVTAE